VKVCVDFDLCGSNGVCVFSAPEVFELRDDGYLYVLEEHPPEIMRAAVQDAADSCPTAAISIED
jgi:ferredoxin